MANDPLQSQVDDPNIFVDVLAAPFRGVEGALQNTWGLADFLTGDILPDWDTRLLGTSETFAGGMVEGASQFLTGFIPIMGQASKIGALGKSGTILRKLSESQIARSAAAGIVTDFTVFNEQEQRLSNLIQQFPDLQNPVTEFLAADEDDGLIEGRLKNALEGLGLGVAVDLMFRGIKGIRAGRKAKANGSTPDDVIEQMAMPLSRSDQVQPGGVVQIDETVFRSEAEEVFKELEFTQEKTLEEEVDDLYQTYQDRYKPNAEATQKGTPKKEKKPQAESETFEYNLKEGSEIKFTSEEARKKADEYTDSLVAQLYQGDSGFQGDIGRGGDQMGIFRSEVDDMGALRMLYDKIKRQERIKPESTTKADVDFSKAQADEYEKLRATMSPEARRAWDDLWLKKADSEIEKADQYISFARSFRLILSNKVKSMVKVAQDFNISDVERKAQIAAWADNIYNFQAREQMLARQMGRGLRDVQFFRAGKPLKATPIEELRTGGREFSEAWLRNRRKEWIDKIVAIIDQGGSEEDIIRKVLGITEKTKGGKWDMAKEYWINNLLSGIPTQMVNILGGGLTTLLDTAEQSIGALMSGRPDVAKAALKSTFTMDAWREAWKWGKQSLKEDQQFLMPQANAALDLRPKAAITSESVAREFPVLDPILGVDKPFYDTFNKIANVMRWPSRGLSGADEFFKQLNARRAAKYKASLEGIEAGIVDPKKLAEYVNKKIEKVITEGGELYSQHTVAKKAFLKARQRELSDEATITYVNKYVKENFDPNASALARYAKDVAEEMTFTKDFESNTLTGDLMAMVQRNPVMSFVIPFIRTPARILEYATRRTFVGMFMKRDGLSLLDELRSTDPRIKAAALGRVTTTATAMASVFPVLSFFSDRFTGGGPTDPDKRKRLEEAGWQPYSFKLPEAAGGGYLAFNRLDPLGTIIGVYADINDLTREGVEVNQEPIEWLGMALLTSLVRNITNKSYLAGIEQFTEAISDESGRGITRFAANLATGFVPFSGLARSGLQNISGAIMDENSAKELRNIGDRLRQFDPLGSGFKLDPRRNLIGEEKEIEGVFGTRATNAINPLRYKSGKNDEVLDEIANLDHSFSTPSPNYRGLINLTEYTNNKGQSAHDRRLELMGTVKIKGKTLRESLQTLIRSREYQKHSPRSEPGLPSPRIRMINTILSRYRAEGLERTLKEYPELNDFYKQYREVQRQQRQGAELDNLIQTLNF